MLTDANKMRGTPEDAPEIRKLLDEVAVRLPSDSLGCAMYRWFAKATEILEAHDSHQHYVVKGMYRDKTTEPQEIASVH